MKEEKDEALKTLKGMVSELDPVHQAEASRFLNNLLKVQRAQQSAQQKADAAIESLKILDAVAAERLEDGIARCSFCGKWQDEVKLLIGGTSSIFICDRCVDTCVKLRKKYESEENNGNEHA